VHYLTQPGPTLADRFAYLIGGLCHYLGAVFTRDRSTGPFTLAVHRRLRRLEARFAALMARVAAGGITPTKMGAVRAPAGPRTARAASPRLMPGGFGWLNRLMPEGNVYASYLEERVLAGTDFAALLAVAPQAGGIARAVLWMMGREVPEILRLAKASRAPRKSRERPAPDEPDPPAKQPYREQPPLSRYPRSVWPTEADMVRAEKRLARIARRQLLPD